MLAWKSTVLSTSSMAYCPICNVSADLADTRCTRCGVAFSFISGVYPTILPNPVPEFINLSLPELPVFSFEETARALDHATQRLSDDNAFALYAAAKEIDATFRELQENLNSLPILPRAQSEDFVVSRFEKLASNTDILKQQLEAALSKREPKSTLEKYVPNEVPLTGRIVLIVSAAIIVVYACIALIWGYSLLPTGGKRRTTAVILVQGLGCIPYAAGLLLAAYALLLQVLDHYDKRDNEHRYAKHSKRVWIAALACVILSGFMLPLFPEEEFAGALPSYSVPVAVGRGYFSVLETVQAWSAGIFIIALATGLLILLPKRHNPTPTTKRIAAVLVATMLFFVGLIIATEAISDLIDGTARISRLNEHILRSENPRMFQAVTFSRILLGAMAAWGGVIMFLFGVLGTFDRFGNFQSPFSSRSGRVR